MRFANVYGPSSGHKGSVVAKFLKDAASSGQLTIYGSGEQTRDFIHVKDLGGAILASIKSEAKGEVFQIATGVETSISQLAQMVSERLAEPVAIVNVASRPGEIIKNYSDITKARQLLGWKPQIALSDGLDETAAWFEGVTKPSTVVV